MKKTFSGLVEIEDRFIRSYDTARAGSVLIGGIDIIEELCDTKFAGNVIIGVADERFTGELFCETGWGYSEFTPMDPDELKVGGHDICNILERYDGKNITLYVSDEPIDILEDTDNLPLEGK